MIRANRRTPEAYFGYIVNNKCNATSDSLKFTLTYEAHRRNFMILRYMNSVFLFLLATANGPVLYMPAVFCFHSFDRRTISHINVRLCVWTNFSGNSKETARVKMIHRSFLHMWLKRTGGKNEEEARNMEKEKKNHHEVNIACKWEHNEPFVMQNLKFYEPNIVEAKTIPQSDMCRENMPLNITHIKPIKSSLR